MGVIILMKGSTRRCRRICKGGKIIICIRRRQHEHMQYRSNLSYHISSLPEEQRPCNKRENRGVWTEIFAVVKSKNPRLIKLYFSIKS